ncbi:hypothetical protein BC940DRAFT_303866 [Gongronella butleri]|nr:hypothetical protein BC940DRAFT_303866 [Gongronella butleri]
MAPQKRHYRKRFNKNQLEILKRAFANMKYPTTPEMFVIARDVDSSMERVQHWFQHERYKEKKKQQQSVAKRIIARNTFFGLNPKRPSRTPS